MNKINKMLLISFLLLFTAFLFVYLLNNSYSYLDEDFGWHLKVGQDILVTKDAPRTNLYNYPLFNEEWINHEWLTDLSMYLIYSNLSYHSLHLFFALLFLITLFFSLVLFFKKNGFWPSFFASVGLILLGTKAALPSLGIRPQELALFFTVLVLYFLNRNRYLCMWLSLIFIIWANLHGSYVLGLGLTIAWQVLAYLSTQRFFNKILSKLNLEFKNIYKKRNWLFLPLLFGMTLINPYGLSLYKSLAEYSNTYYLTNISEWLPQFYYPFLYWQLLFLGLSSSFFVVYYYEKYKTKGRIDVWKVFLFIFFFILALKSKRHFPLFFVVNLPFLAEIFLYFGKQLKDFKLSYLKCRVSLLGTSLVLIIFSYSLLASLNYHHDPFTSFCNRYPCRAVNFLKNNENIIKDLNTFNDYNWGGFMIWNYSQKQIFIDGRMPHYPFKEKSYLEEYHKFFKTEENFLELVMEHDIGLFFINKKSNLTKEPTKLERQLFFIDKKGTEEKKFDMFSYLENSDRWYKFFEDDVALIYIRNYDGNNLPAN
jgi:hypothetical protein